MWLIKKLLIKLKFVLLVCVLVKCERTWIYELISIENINETPDIIFGNLKVVRLSRGVFVSNGTLELRQDLTDDLLLSAQVYYNPTGGKNFVKTPFRVPEATLSNVLNTAYKDMLMETAVKCIENAPNFEDKFIAPLTKRVLIFRNCHADAENMPSVLKKGYYKIEVKYTKQARGSIIYTVKIEEK